MRLMTLALLLAAFFGSANLYLAPDIRIAQALGPSVEVGSIVLAEDATGQVDVTYRDIPSHGLKGYYLILSYDPTVVHITGVLPGDSPFDVVPVPGVNQGILDIDNGAGTATLQTELTVNGPTSGDQVVIRLQLLAAGRAGHRA